jgi:hypothetical protein
VGLRLSRVPRDDRIDVRRSVQVGFLAANKNVSDASIQSNRREAAGQKAAY